MCSICLMSCVSQKNYDSLNDEYQELQDDYARLKREFSDLQDEYKRMENISEKVIEQINEDVNSQLDELNGQIRVLTENNRNLRYSIWVIQDKIRYGRVNEAIQITEYILKGN